ncbi:MAG: flagellar hook-length control protein FliK [Turicibacter sp.]|nr:flagellar hook-length control protein FliK [Turicibacter sp.]
MDINVLNASINFKNNSSPKKALGEQHSEFNQTFSNALDKNSMNSLNQQENDDKNIEENMDDLAATLVQTSLLTTPIVFGQIGGEETVLQSVEDESSVLMNQLNGFDSLSLRDTLTNSQMTFTDNLDQKSITMPINESIVEGVNNTLTHQELVTTKNADVVETLSQTPLEDSLNVDVSLSEVTDEEGLKPSKNHINSMSNEVDANTQSNTSSNSETLTFKQSFNHSQGINQESELLEDIEFKSSVTSDSMITGSESIHLNESIVTHKLEASVNDVQSQSTSTTNYLRWENQSEIIDNLRHQISLLRENDSTTLHLKLYPQHLGAISVELKMKNGVLNADVLVEHPELKAVLEQEFHQINLDGTKIEQLNVEVNSQRHQQSQSQTPNKESKKFMLEEEVVEEIQVVEKQTQPNGYLNLTV